MVSKLIEQLRDASRQVLQKWFPDVSPLPTFAGKPLLTIRAVGGPSLGTPRGTYFARPKVALTADGTLHMVWTEPPPGAPGPRSEAADSTSFEPEKTRLLYARHRNGAWTAPQEIFRTNDDIGWGQSQPSRLIVGPEETLHLSVITNDYVVHYLRRGPQGGWTTVETGAVDYETAYAAVYTSLSVGPDGENLTIAFVGPAGDGDKNSVFATRSRDGGTTWTTATLVSRSGSQLASEPKLRAGPDGRLHLLWDKSKSGGVWPEVFWYAVSEDDGATWSNPSEIDLARPPSDSQAAFDQCGTLHVLFGDSIGSADKGIYHFRRRGEGWTEPRRLTPETNRAVSLIMSADPSGQLHLAWLRIQDIPTDVAGELWPKPQQVSIAYSHQRVQCR